MTEKKTTMFKINMLVTNQFLNDSRVLKEAVSASKAGFQVQVIALGDHENKLPRNESFEGWNVKRIVLTSTKIWSKIEAIKLPIQYFEYIVKVVKESRSAHIIHINDLEALPAAVISKLLSFGRIKILYDVHEMETQCSGYGSSETIKYLLRIGERCCIPFVDSTITVSDSIADWYQKHYGIVRPSIIRNIPEMHEANVLLEQYNRILSNSMKDGKKSRKINMVVAKDIRNDSRVLKEVAIASKAGFQVQIVALGDHKNFAEWDVKQIVLTTTKIWSEIQIIKLPIQYLKYTIILAKECRTANIIHANDFQTLPAAVIIKLLSFGKIKILYDAHELETDRAGLFGLRKLLFHIGESCCIPFADSIITVSDSIADWYQKHYRIARPGIVRNIPQTNKIIQNENDPDLKRKFNLKKTDILFIYQGGLAQGRGIERLLEIFSKVKKNRHIVFMGYGPLSTEVQQYVEINQNIHYLPAVPPEDVLAHTATADIGIYLMENICLNHYYSLPNKLFEYILAGLPVIINDLPDQRSIIEQFNCGWIAAENDEWIIDFINTIESEEISKKKEGLRHAQNTLSWENEASVLLEQYNRILRV